jgi:2-polyprenyl-3-methyl-5-hydroxy-6-metoxy-1,4-benzoquinol methylase
MKKILDKIYKNAAALNFNNINSLLEKNSSALFLDLGCDDGELSMKLAEKIGTKNIYGAEIVQERLSEAESRGIKVKKINLNNKFDYENNYFDVIHANQVIEHLTDSDNFVSEIYRILKIGGYAIISTENASSWCNIFSSIMGWQIFSLTNFSSEKPSIGNPLSIHRGEKSNLSSWNHVRIYNIYGLKDYFEAFGFKTEAIKGAGYFPLPAILGCLDKTHSHFITFKIRK